MEEVEGTPAAQVVCLAGGGVLAAAGHADGLVSLWRCNEAGSPSAAGRFRVQGHEGVGSEEPVCAAAIDTSGRLACAAAGAMLTLFDAAAGRAISTEAELWAPGDNASVLSSPPAASGASPALRGALFGTSAGIIGLWDPRCPQGSSGARSALGSFARPAASGSFAARPAAATALVRFASAGGEQEQDLVLATSRSGGAVVLDPRQPGAQLLELRGHARAITATAVADFGSMGPRAATASGDWTVRLWDLRSGACVATLAGAAGPAVGVRLWGGRGHGLLVAAHADGTLRPWRLKAYGGFGGAASASGTPAGAWERRAPETLHAGGGLPLLAAHEVPGEGGSARMAVGGGAHWSLWDLPPLGSPDGPPPLQLAAAARATDLAVCSAVCSGGGGGPAALLVGTSRGRLLRWSLPAPRATA